MHPRRLTLSATLRLAIAWLVALGLLLAPLPRAAPVAANTALRIAGISVALCGHGDAAAPDSPAAPKPAGHECCDCSLCPAAHSAVAMLLPTAPVLPVLHGFGQLPIAAGPALPDSARRYSPSLARAPPLSAPI